MFQPVEGNVNFPEQELAVGRFWKEHRIYEKSLERRAGAPAHDPLFAGVAELVATLAGRDDIALGIATGKSRRGVARWR